jgi:hypothetical protein
MSGRDLAGGKLAQKLPEESNIEMMPSPMHGQIMQLAGRQGVQVQVQVRHGSTLPAADPIPGTPSQPQNPAFATIPECIQEMNAHIHPLET